MTGIKGQAETIADLLDMLGVEDKPKEFTMQDTREAFRRSHAKTLSKAYRRAEDSFDAEYSSASHFVAGVLGLLMDSVYTLWDPIEGMIGSEVTRALMEEELEIPRNKPLLEAIMDLKDEKLGKETDREDLEKAQEALDRSVRYMEGVTKYSNEHGMSPAEVIENADAMVGIIESAYGSLDAYEELRVKNLQSRF